jgi:hypothetical protein
VRPTDHVAPADVDVVLEAQGDRLRGERLDQRCPSRPGYLRHPRREARRQHDNLVARLEHAARDRPRVAAVVVELAVGAVLRPDHVLDREPGVDQVPVGGDVNVLEVMQQRHSVVPSEAVAALDDVVAVQRGHRYERQVVHLELHGEAAELVADALEAFLRPVDEVHLVDADDEVRDSEKARDEGVAPRLLQHAVASVDEDHREVRCGSAGDHVARVLHVPGCVRDDELAPWRREVAVGDVDGDPLLTLRSQAVGQQGQVGVAVAALAARALDRLELVGEDRLRVVEEPTDQRRLAVVDAAGGSQAEKLGH